jgi:hypothetical protein
MAWFFIATGQLYLAVSCWVPFDPRPGVENGSSYILRWNDDITGGQDGGFGPFQVLPTASVDVAYAEWPAEPSEKSDSLGGKSHLLVLACPGSVSNNGYVSIYKFSVLVHNILIGTTAHLYAINQRLTVFCAFEGGPGYFLHLETLPFIRPTGVITFSIPKIGNFLAGTFSASIVGNSNSYHSYPEKARALCLLQKKPKLLCTLSIVCLRVMKL